MTSPPSAHAFARRLLLTLPQGRLLPEDAWQRRHHALLAVLWVHAAGISLFGVVRGYGVLHSAVEASAVAAFGLAAVVTTRRTRRRKLASALVAVGLLTSSALVVHFSGGVIEAHFHFFVMLALLLLYEDWIPYLLAFGYVVVHHGLFGMLEPTAVYNHPSAQEEPWRWAIIHGVFVAGAGVANVVAWRLNETVRARMRTALDAATESEERFRSIFASAPIALALLDLQGRIVDGNAQLNELLGHSTPDGRNGHFSDFLAEPDERAEATKNWAAIASGKRPIDRIERRIRRPDDQIVWARITVSIVSDVSQRPSRVIAMLEDVTERKRAEEVRSRLAAITESAQDAIYAQTLDGVITSWNAAAERLYGYSAEEAIGKPVSMLTPPNLADETPELRRRVAAAEVIEPFETVHVRKDGRLVEIALTMSPIRDEHGAIVETSATARDITERKRAERALAQSRLQLADVEAMAHVGSWEWNIPQKTIAWSAEMFCIWGWDRESTPTYDAFLESVQPDDRERVNAAVRATLEGGSPYDGEYRIRRTDGDERVVHARGNVYFDASGVAERMVGTVQDVTERKRAETELERLLEQEREQVQRLREIDQMKDSFVASVSHELRTPLTSIRGYVDLLREGAAGAPTPEQEHFLSIVDRNADRLLRVVGDLLFVAQFEAGKLALEQESVDVAAIAYESAEAASPTAESRHVELRAEIEPTPEIIGDRARLAQLIDNLVSNAIKFTPKGGRVTMRCRALDDRVVLEVSDTGIGIPVADLDRLFERFYRTEVAVELAIPGTGLGLSIARAIAEAHGGSILVSSAEGAGTTFNVALPLAASAQHASAPQTVEAA